MLESGFGKLYAPRVAVFSGSLGKIGMLAFQAAPEHSPALRATELTLTLAMLHAPPADLDRIRRQGWLLACVVTADQVRIALPVLKSNDAQSAEFLSRLCALGYTRWFADLLLYLFGLSAYLLIALCAGTVIRGYRRLRVQASPPRKDDELPRLPTGKLYKRLLRDGYWPAQEKKGISDRTR